MLAVTITGIISCQDNRLLSLVFYVKSRNYGH